MFVAEPVAELALAAECDAAVPEAEPLLLPATALALTVPAVTAEPVRLATVVAVGLMPAAER